MTTARSFELCPRNVYIFIDYEEYLIFLCSCTFFLWVLINQNYTKETRLQIFQNLYFIVKQRAC